MQRRQLNLPQRVVLVVGLGAALYFFGGWATTWGSGASWNGYAPLQSSASFSPFIAGLFPWVRLCVWFILVAVWVGVSLVVLRSPAATDVGDRSSPQA